MRGEAKNRKGEKRKVREGYRGYLVYAMTIEQVMQMVHNGFASSRVKDYPGESKDHPLIWPVMDDWEGAKALVDAVLGKDLPFLRSAIQRFPTYDLGLDKYIERLELEQSGGESIVRQVIREKIYNGHRVCTELETSKIDGKRSIVIAIYRGHSRLLSKTIAREPEGSHV